VNNLRAGGGAGHLRIAVLPALGLGVTPRAIAEFRAGHADVTFDVQTVDHVNILRCLYERESDIAIGFSAPAHPRLRSEKIGTGELGLLQREGTVAVKGHLVDVRKLQDQQYVSLTGSGPIGALLAGELARLEVQPREVVAARTFYVAAALVRHGVGVTVLDEFTARDMSSAGMTFSRLTPAIPFAVHCMWLEEKPPSALCRQFIDTFAGQLACAIG
jgi:DNA-binding transcriptional LysR family regulator